MSGDTLEAWAGRTGHHRAARRSHGGLRFAFYGRVSTEDWQDPVTSRARQRDQAAALVAGHGRIVAEFFDTGYSRTLAWARRPQAAALVTTLADPDRGWDAIVIGEYERAFYGAQYAAMAPLSEHYGIQLWTPEAGGQIDYGAEDHEQVMLALGLSSKREIARTRIRVRTAMAGCARLFRGVFAIWSGTWPAWTVRQRQTTAFPGCSASRYPAVGPAGMLDRSSALNGRG